MLALRDPHRVGMIRQRAGHDLDDVPDPAHDAGCSATASAGGAG
jgi:hypothetical protein